MKGWAKLSEIYHHVKGWAKVSEIYHHIRISSVKGFLRKHHRLHRWLYREHTHTQYSIEERRVETHVQLSGCFQVAVYESGLQCHPRTKHVLAEMPQGRKATVQHTRHAHI